MELISREEAMRILKEDLDASRSRGDDERADACFLHYVEISNIPTIEERKEGEWIELQQNDDGTHNIQCSVCRFCFKSKGHARSYYTRKHYAFCPHCGAKMKGE